MFCRSKPVDERYDRRNSMTCALGQFLGEGVWYDNCESHGISRAAYSAAVFGGHDPMKPIPYEPEVYTFGALAKRLEALLCHSTT